MIKSDGGSSSYYELPQGAKELQDLIEFKDMNHSRGECFAALYRMGMKEGIDDLYNWKKVQFYANRQVKLNE